MKRIKEVIPYLIALAGKSKNELLEGLLMSFWEDIVGAKISRRSQPARLQDGRLTIAISDPDWLSILQGMKGLIKERINSYLKGNYITDIIFQLNPRLHPSRPKRRKPPLPPEPGELSPQMKEIIEKIPDQELRVIFSQSVRRYLAYTKKSPSWSIKKRKGTQNLKR